MSDAETLELLTAQPEIGMYKEGAFDIQTKEEAQGCLKYLEKRRMGIVWRLPTRVTFDVGASRLYIIPKKVIPDPMVLSIKNDKQMIMTALRRIASHGTKASD